MLDQNARRDAFDFTSHFRDDYYRCLTRRGDMLFELTDAMLCAAAVRSLHDVLPPGPLGRGARAAWSTSPGRAGHPPSAWIR